MKDRRPTYCGRKLFLTAGWFILECDPKDDPEQLSDLTAAGMYGPSIASVAYFATAVFRGLPPFAPFTFAASDFAWLRTCPPRLPVSRAVIASSSPGTL